jgi:two-component system alkaline phosphatase synthesis response regulator PhoP
MNNQNTSNFLGAVGADKKRVLCIDDEAQSLVIRKQLLERAGYEVLSCEDPKAGLALFSTSEVHMVVLGHCMPEWNGAEVAEAMRRIKPDVPIIMLSGNPELPNIVEHTVHDLIVKGENPRVLSDKMHDLLTESAGSHRPNYLQASA